MSARVVLALCVATWGSACADEPARSSPSAPAPAPAPAAPPTAAPPTAAPPTAGEPGHRFAKLAHLTVPLPATWDVKENRAPPKHFLHVTPGPNGTCDIGLLEDHGRPEEAERYLNAGAAAYAGEVTRNADLLLGEVAFQGIHVARPKALAELGDAVVDVYVAILGKDLVGVSFTAFSPAFDRQPCQEAFSGIVKLLQ